MRNLLNTLLFFCTLTFVFQSKANLYLRQGLYVGFSTQFFKSSSYNQFVNSYNEVNTKTIKKKLDPSKSLNGLTLGYSIFSNSLLFQFEYNTLTGSKNVEFNDNGIRKMKTSNNNVNITMGFFKQKSGSKIYFHPFIGVGLGSNKIVASYTKGTDINNTGDFLNGTYKTSCINFNYGIHLQTHNQIKNYFLKIQMNAPLAVSTMYEKESTKILATDYNSYVNSQLFYIGDAVSSDFKGLNIQLGMLIRLDMFK